MSDDNPDAASEHAPGESSPSEIDPSGSAPSDSPPESTDASQTPSPEPAVEERAKLDAQAARVNEATSAYNPWRQLVHRGLCVVLVSIGVVWLSSTLWPANPTGAWPFVAELQASAFLGAILIAVGGAVLRSIRRAFLVAVVGVLVVVLVPRIPLPFPADGEHSTRVMSLNTQFGRANDSQIIEHVKEIEPDVLVLEETNPSEALTVAKGARYTLLNEPRPGRSGAGGVSLLVSSEYLAKLSEGGGYRVREVPGLTEFQMPVLQLPNGGRIVGVHAVAPMGPSRAAWESELERVGAWSEPLRVAAERAEDDSSTPIPHLVIAGDFNSTRAHPRLRSFDMVSCTGYVAHRPTWPSSAPVIRIDHVLSTADCAGGGVAKVDGTDHLAVWADVNIG